MEMIISIVGAAAWVPIVAKFIIDFFRKINVVYLDRHFIYNVEDALIHHDGEFEKQTGMVLIFALNFFVYGKPFFARNILCELELKNGTKYKSILYEGELGYYDSKDSPIFHTFQFPMNTNINSNRSIVPNLDNIRIIPFWFEGLNLHDDKTIKRIIFKFKGSFSSKKIILTNSDCVKMNYINKFDVAQNDKVYR